MARLSQVNETPVYTTTLPSTGGKVKYRPFLVAEERALLTASESEDADTMYSSMEQVVRNCLLSSVEFLTTFDVEFLFITIRSKSVGETSDIQIQCEDCGKSTPVTINLKDVHVVTAKDHNKKIELAPEKIVLMKYPSVEDMLEISDAEDRYDKLLKLTMHSVYYKEDIYVIEEESEEEIEGFIKTLTAAEYNKLKHFIDTIPFVEIKHSWKCSNSECGKQQNTELKGIFAFF